jgi:hypothetical protein
MRKLVLTPMADELLDYLIKRTARLMYNAYMQEAISDALLDFWSRFEAISAFLIAVTATGSTIAGWAVWQTQRGIVIWGVFSGTASILALISGTFQIPGRVKTQNELSSAFRDIGIRAEDLFDTIRGLTVQEIEKQLAVLEREYRDALKRTQRDIIMTRRWRARLQKLLNERMEEKGYVRHSASI